jgi:hypothetical protein
VEALAERDARGDAIGKNGLTTSREYRKVQSLHLDCFSRNAGELQAPNPWVVGDGWLAARADL